jgi:type I restriction enzyme R subunit
VPLKPERQGGGKIRVRGLEVTIADEAVFLIEATGQQLTLDEYQDYTRRQVTNTAPSRRILRDIWVDPERRRMFLEDLRRSSIHPEVLAEVLGQTETNTFDLLSNLAFGGPIHTRSERVAAFSNSEQDFLQRHGDAAGHVVLELLEKYRVGGIDQLHPEVFRISPFSEWGGAVTISRWFGGVQALGTTLTELQQRIYPETEVA